MSNSDGVLVVDIDWLPASSARLGSRCFLPRWNGRTRYNTLCLCQLPHSLARERVSACRTRAGVSYLWHQSPPCCTPAPVSEHATEGGEKRCSASCESIKRLKHKQAGTERRGCRRSDVQPVPVSKPHASPGAQCGGARSCPCVLIARCGRGVHTHAAVTAN
jgi:hypothetical protein